MTTFYIGIDPGWKNLGFTLLKEEDGQLTALFIQTFNVSEMTIEGLITELTAELKKHDFFGTSHKRYVAIERYVAYNNIFTSDSERILLVIGALYLFFKMRGSDIRLYRAIDWKTELVKLLTKHHGFDNPSTSLDKKFSIAAAVCCLGNKEFKNDHEADSICLASLGSIKAQAAKIRSAKTG